MLDYTKPVRTRDGRPARVICTDRALNDRPVIALVKMEDGHEGVCAYTREGRYTKTFLDPLDLVNVPEKVRVRYWLNVYPPDTPNYLGFHESRDAADGLAAPGRIACIEIDREVEVGEGL